MRIFKNLSVMLFCCVASVFADDRLGVNTHFDQGWNPSQVIPTIPPAGIGWIRDVLSWPKFELVRGRYKLPQSFIDWVTIAGQNGLKVDLCLAYGNNLYADPFDVTAFTNAVAWLTPQLMAYPAVQAIEILNEPNNVFFQYEGPNWKQKYVTLLNSAYSAIKTANPRMTVIGLGAQTGDDFAMLALGANADGFTAHPYPAFLPIPETAFEPPYYRFDNFCFAWLLRDTRARWDTEWGVDTTAPTTQYTQALFTARRLCLSMGMEVTHTFIYDFKDDTNQLFGLLDASLNQKQSYQAVQRIMSSIHGMASIEGDLYVNSLYSDGAFDYMNFYGFSFQSGNGGASVAVAWTGNSYPSQAFFTSHTGRLSFTHPAAQSVTALNTVTGVVSPVIWVQFGNRVVLINAQVTNEPILYIAK
jgi:hypothetical protein